MKEINIIIEVTPREFGNNLSIPKIAFSNLDLATLHCAKMNLKSATPTYYHLTTIPFIGDTEIKELSIERKEGEIIVTDYENDEINITVTLASGQGEDSIIVDSIKLCGTDINDLTISNDLKRRIKHEADNYKEEVIEKQLT